MINDSNEVSLAHLLDPSPEQIRSWANAAVEVMAEYLGTIRDRRVYPSTSSRQIREQLDSSLPEESVNFDELLHTFRNTLLELSRHNGHPRMFGYVQAPGTAIAAIADLLASTLNANLTAWRSAPAAVELERLTIDWIKQLLHYEANATGLFVSGGSMANFAALAAAYCAKAPVDLLRRGARSLARTMRVDAAYGGFATLSHSTRGLFDGIERADSIALDPHKWLYLPADCGCVLYRDPKSARATFAQDAEYTRVIGQQADEAFAFWDYG